MASASYIARRDALETYFDRTAIESWKAFATDAPISRVRRTVRAGRAAMRALMLEQLPTDLASWRVFDAGCGTGAMTHELAARGAQVLGVDLSPASIRFARENWPQGAPSARTELLSGDMLGGTYGTFAATVAMDSLIHYAPGDALEAIVALASRTRRRIVLTHAPATRALRLMHAAGKLFPRSDRSPRIVPVEPCAFRAAITAALDAATRDGRLDRRWAVGASRRVSRGFYTSQMVVLHSEADAA